MRLLVGLGNPGPQYARNRHNVGFMAVSRLATEHRAAFTRRQGRALVTSIRIGEKSVVIAKPQTYMNHSGESVGPLFRYWKLDLASPAFAALQSGKRIPFVSPIAIVH